MQVDVHKIDGSVSGKLELPEIFSKEFREDLVRRALLAEQSMRYQPQAHYILAGMQTTATYFGAMNSYRTGRHMGIAIRPRQKLGGGAQGDVRRIPSSVKGRRAHPHMVEKIITERINAKEYRKAIISAISGSALGGIKSTHSVKNSPIVVDDSFENIANTKELIKALGSLGLTEDIQRSHKPKLRKGLRRNSKRRLFRKSVLIVANNAEKIRRAGRNIAGVDVCGVNELRVELLAPGSRPRPAIWTNSAIKGAAEAIEKLKL